MTASMTAFVQVDIIDGITDIRYAGSRLRRNREVTDFMLNGIIYVQCDDSRHLSWWVQATMAAAIDALPEYADNIRRYYIELLKRISHWIHSLKVAGGPEPLIYLGGDDGSLAVFINTVADNRGSVFYTDDMTQF